MSELDVLAKREENFGKLEDRFKNLISMCDRSNFVEELKDSSPFGIRDVKNATSCECYQLGNGLYVYEFKSGEQSICFRISSSPLYEKYTYGPGGRPGNDYVGYHNLKGTFFEYSCGGIGNSTPIDNVDKYPTVKHISVRVADERGRAKSQLIMSEMHPIDVNLFGLFHEFSWNVGLNILKEGDFFELIKIPVSERNSDRDKLTNVIENLKSILANIDELVSSRKSSERKGFLKTLLGRNKQLDGELDVFAIGGRGRKKQ